MDKKYKLNNRYEILDYETNKYIFDNETGFVFEINDIGFKIIELIKANKSLKEINLFVSVKYNKDKNDIIKDIVNFINQLLDREIISPID